MDIAAAPDTVAIWVIAAVATAGVVVRPWHLPEAIWAAAGALSLVAFGLLPWRDALAGAAKGTDVYLFLVGMMLLAELAREGFTGTVAELRARLDSMVSDTMRRSVRWPKAPNGLSSALRRMAATLRAAGIQLQFSRNNERGRRMVSVLPYATQVRKDRQ